MNQYEQVQENHSVIVFLGSGFPAKDRIRISAVDVTAIAILEDPIMT
jgi:hypothetical protein